MTKEEFNAKVQAVFQDPAFIEEAQKAQNSDEMAKLLNAHGIEITAEDLDSYSTNEEGELNTEDMTSVAGGFSLSGLLKGIGSAVGLVKDLCDLSPSGPYGKQLQGISNYWYNKITGRK